MAAPRYFTGTAKTSNKALAKGWSGNKEGTTAVYRTDDGSAIAGASEITLAAALALREAWDIEIDATPPGGRFS